MLTNTTDEQYSAARLAWSKVYDLRSCVERALVYAVFLRVRGYKDAIVICEHAPPETWADDARLSSWTATRAMRDLELRGVLHHVDVKVGDPLPHGGVAERDEHLTLVVPSDAYKSGMPGVESETSLADKVQIPGVDLGTSLAFAWQLRLDWTPEERTLIALVYTNRGPMAASVIAEKLSVGLPLAMLLRERIPRLLEIFIAELGAPATPQEPETPAERAALAAVTRIGRTWIRSLVNFRKGKASLPPQWRVAHTSSQLSVYAHDDLLAVAFDHRHEKPPQRWRSLLLFSSGELSPAKTVEAGAVFIGAGKRVEFAGALFDIEEIAGLHCVLLGHQYDNPSFQGHFALDVDSLESWLKEAGHLLAAEHMVS